MRMNKQEISENSPNVKVPICKVPVSEPPKFGLAPSEHADAE